MTPEQLSRRRASREAWRARNPYEWRARRARNRANPSGSSVPDAAGRSGSPAALIAELESLQQRAAEIKNGLLVNQSGVPDGPAVRQRSGSPATVVSPPLARDVQSGPPPESTSYRVVSLTTTTSAPVPDRSAVVVASGAPRNEASVWDDAKVLAALERRPGIDVEILRARIADWLTTKPHCRLTVGTVLSFIERWRPGIDDSPRRRDRHAVAVDGPAKPWITEQMAAIARQQSDLLGVAF